LALAAFLDEPALQAALAEGEGERDPYKLYLPEALERAMGQVMAGKILYSGPQRFGYDQPKGWPALSARRVQLAEPMGVKDLAKSHGVDYKTFRAMNPHLLADTAPAGAWLNVP
jgi:hypothetical protein